MAKGVLYVMETAVNGIVKIGKAATDNFEKRMYDLQHAGYRNMPSLRFVYAIEVEDYHRKEKLLQTIFANQRAHNAELFAVNVDIVVELLKAFDWREVRPYSCKTKAPESVIHIPRHPMRSKEKEEDDAQIEITPEELDALLESML